jgi:Ca2+-binding RTX toxin-like protein
MFLDPTPATRGETPVDRTDGLSVLLHEVGHALGFTGYYNETTNSFGGYQTPFDQRLRVIGGQTYFDGPNVRALLGGPVELTDFNYGHYGNSNEYPPFTTDPLVGLMNGVVYYRGYNYAISDIDLAMMADMGLGTIRDDILELAGHFSFRGGLGNDTIRGGNDINQLFGDEGNDRIYGRGGVDALYGGDGDDLLDGGTDSDNMTGGAGNDTYYVDHANDFLIEVANGGIDTIRTPFNTVLADNFENLLMVGAARTGTGNSADNRITGNNLANTLTGLGGNDTLVGGDGVDTLHGGTGNDSLFGGTSNDVLNGDDNNDRLQGDDGNDTLNGGIGDDMLFGNAGLDILNGNEGADRLQGGAARDRMYGGAGADWFIFDDGDFGAMSVSGADQIYDFNRVEGDKIRLNLVDANLADGADQVFSFIGASAFTNVAGQLRYQQSGGNTYIMGDQTGDGAADFWVRVDGVHALVATDFTL